MVTKLLNIVRPDFAFFGQKDAQQTIVIKRLTEDLALPTEIIARPTLRDADGLALSSRNAYLSAEQRAAAPIIYRALQEAEALYASGERDAAHFIETVGDLLLNEPLARPDYVAVTDAETLEPLAILSDERATLISLAAYFGKTRLIDNIIITPPRRGTGPLTQP
jgi:pantoate--beta-alanine ligase